MRIITTTLTSAALLLAVAASGHANDQAKFDRLVRKHVAPYATQLGNFAPKTLCVCEPGGVKRAGVLLNDSGFIGCVAPNFDNGSLVSFTSCASYVVIGK